MLMKARAVWGILLMNSLITLSQSSKLNVPKLLLPLSARVPVNITLTAERGCYTWVSSKPECVRVYPLSAVSPPDPLPASSCSQQCLVSTLSSPQALPIHSVVKGQDNEVTLSEEGYRLVVDGYRGRMCSDRICVDQETTTVTAFKLGHATLTIVHNNLPSKVMSHLPRATIYVVEPSYMTLGIKEEEDIWVLEKKRQYYLTVRIHDNEGHAVHLSQNVVIVVEETEGLITLESTSDSSVQLLKTLGTGKTSIQASLHSIISKNGEKWLVIPPIRVQQEVDIYNPLSLHPSMIVFPWQPHNKLYRRNITILYFQVEGGSGSVMWDVSNSQIATVTVKGVIIAGQRLGQSRIQAADYKNPLHRVVGQVMVVRPSRLQLVPRRGDCRVGDRIELPVALWGILDPQDSCSHTDFDTHLYTHRSTNADVQAQCFSHRYNPQNEESFLMKSNLVPVTDCTELSLHIHTEPIGIFTRVPGPVSPGAGFCGGVRFKAISQGQAVVTVTVETEGSKISETTSLEAYNPLKSLASKVLLTVGTARMVVFEGGPQPWPSAPIRFFRHIEAQPSGGVTVETVSSAEGRPTRHAYWVTCNAVGEQWLVFRCGNTPGPLNEMPAMEESRVQVSCGVPASLSVSVLPCNTSSPSCIPLYSNHSSCPQHHHPWGPLTVSSSRDAVFQLSVFDQKGEQFDNFTSCSVKWTTSDPHLLSLPPQSTMNLADKPTQTGYKLHAWKVLQVHQQTGTVTVNVTLRCPEMSTAPVSQHVILHLVEDVQWATHSLTLFNHPKVKENLTLFHGSGHFQFHLQDMTLAHITHLENTNMVQVSPLHPGSSVLLAHDLCLTSDPAVVSILISDITDFQIDFIDIIEVGRTAIVRVGVLDSKNQPFLSHFLSLMNLILIPSSSIISVKQVGPVDLYSVGFPVTGLAVGVASFHLSAVAGHGGVISTSHKNIQVYPPFRLQPYKLTLVVGGVRQVKWKGGPHPQSVVEFSVSDSSVAMVTDKGLVRGVAKGVVKISGTLQTVRQDTGALLTLAQDVVELEVFNLIQVRIQAPLVTLSVGTEMPVYVMGSDSDQNPLSLGSVESGLSFFWSLSKPGVLEIKARHAEVGVSVSPSHSFSVLVRAEAPGKASIKVCMQLEQTHASNSSLSDHLTDEIQIQVFEEIQLAAGSPRSILMSPQSQYSLQSNKDSICPVRYVLSECVSGAGLITVNEQGVLRAGPDTGAALLEVFVMDVCGFNQTLLISVKVSAVWFVRILAASSSLNSDAEKALPAFPLGWKINIVALYYNHMGEQFHSHNIQTTFTTNRDDLVHLTTDKDSKSFLVQTVSPGLTILMVQGDPTNPSLSDYIPLLVLPAISEPPGSLRPGDVICFNSPITNLIAQQGRWNVSSSQILQMNSETGVALAKNSGIVVVYYKLEGGQQTLRQVTVEPASVPLVSVPADRLLTNWPEASEYIVKVDLNTYAANTAQCTLDQWEAVEKNLQPEAKLQCLLHFSAPYLQMKTLQAVFHASSFYDINTAQYSCRIFVQPQSNSILHVLSTLSLSISLSVSLQTQSYASIPLPFPLSSTSVQSSVLLPYVPAFCCPVTEITLSPQHPVAEITLFGTKDMLSTLQVHSDTPDIVVSKFHSAEDPTLLHLSIYSTSHFLDQLSSPASITLFTQLSTQTHIVRVTRLVDSQKSVLAAAAALFIAYNAMLSHIQTQPAVYTDSNHTEQQRHMSVWLAPSDRSLQRRQLLWSAR
ncbi:nuclear pore membrane glycoprotein 210-like isoform X5 [Triplophysa dalaica]|uniref:nuclear pore membrane glycoprotein 210-like isoform X5 n=1 Tax=Triplophysa dalaica TaxID=1582913 RepID=UPI0024E021A5|nr:nuclear pore membrane glycoprotein 210-like isoform X5 [Triplophysa dalaica]